MSELADKVVVVTGGGRGIGRAIALAAAQARAKVIVADFGGGLHGGDESPVSAVSVVEEIAALGGEAVASIQSVATVAGGRSIVGAAIERWGRIDGAVCCAGIVRHRPFLELSEKDFDDVIATHLKGHFSIFQPALAAMAKLGNGGSLIGISSGYVLGDPSRAPYRAAKAGVVALTKSVALAGEEYGVRANLISPIANTRMAGSSGLKFASEPEDIAPMAVYLLSDRAKFVSGELFSVAGNSIGIWADARESRAAHHHARWDAESIAEIAPWLFAGEHSRPTKVPPLPEAARLAK